MVIPSSSSKLIVRSSVSVGRYVPRATHSSSFGNANNSASCRLFSALGQSSPVFAPEAAASTYQRTKASRGSRNSNIGRDRDRAARERADPPDATRRQSSMRSRPARDRMNTVSCQLGNKRLGTSPIRCYRELKRPFQFPPIRPQKSLASARLQSAPSRSHVAQVKSLPNASRPVAARSSLYTPPPAASNNSRLPERD